MNIKFLHAQLNPHFFFNVLNNLYGVSLTDPDRVPGLLLKLSDLMRYQLENGNKPLVSLSEEVNYILNYMSMEQERIGKRCEIEKQVSVSAMEAEEYKIAPLILMPLVENAFKHSLTIRNKWFVHICISRSDDRLSLLVRNSLPDPELESESIGIGLANTRERLELLYKNRYTFNSKVVGETYETDLVLQLNRF
jgi:LytS/YehU family sensor histidine kinase